MSKQGLIDNAKHLAGMAVGVWLRYSGQRFGKSARGTRWYSTVAANLVADREPCEFLPFK